MENCIIARDDRVDAPAKLNIPDGRGYLSRKALADCFGLRAVSSLIHFR